ncbi:MAG: rhodanese-like domain-containing protein [Bacteroidetes bacterium]|jgi:phage shock protein E|nr:rhodanese-like domain-containing protein [Bacteroidota bacterium]
MASIEDKIKAGALVVDVRTPEEFQDEHFAGALNIPVEDVMRRLSEFGDKSKPVIVYCATGSRSAYAARFLRTAGYVDVTNAGGLYDMPGYGG